MNRLDILSEKVFNIILESLSQNPRPDSGMNSKYIYHCARKKDLPSIFKFGFERFYFGTGVGEMYGSGIYCTTDLASSIVNSYRGVYGPIIVRAEIKTYNRCLIWEPKIAKAVYGNKWRISDQLEMFMPECIEEMKRLKVIGRYNDGSTNMYDLLIGERERTSVAAEQIWLQRDNFTNCNPYDKVRGFVFYGANDGHVAVLKDAKNAIPLEYSPDHGKTWVYARTEETLRYTRDDFDVELDYGKKYKKTNPVEFGFSRVENNKGKFNYIDKDGKELSPIWFDTATNFDKVYGIEIPVAEVTINDITIYVFNDGQVYQSLDDDYPICLIDEIEEYL